jgi:hypothetical protein
VLLALQSPVQPDALAHSPHSAVDFSMEVDVDGDTTDDCGTDAGQSTTCAIALNAPFRTREYLNGIGDVPSYLGMMLHFGFGGGVTPLSDPDSVWPGCVTESFYYEPAFGHAACSVGANPPSTYTGLVGLIYFTCASDGTIDLMHGINVWLHTHLTEVGTTRHAEGEQTSEVVNITCAQPSPYPTDTDGDGCPDAREASANEVAGGRRNFFSSFDYSNPTGDGLNRVDDIVAVANKYFVDQGEPGYTASTDRTLFGPNAWNTGPPNGLQRIDDIVNQTKQYFHDCS